MEAFHTVPLQAILAVPLPVSDSFEQDPQVSVTTVPQVPLLPAMTPVQVPSAIVGRAGQVFKVHIGAVPLNLVPSQVRVKSPLGVVHASQDVVMVWLQVAGPLVPVCNELGPKV